MLITKEISNVQQWGNSTAFRLPVKLVNLLGFRKDDKVEFLVEMDEKGNKRLVIERIKDVPNTIEDLFKDYHAESFQAEILEFDPIGEEKW